MPRGGTLGYRGGWGAKIFFFPKFSQIWCRILRERGDLRWRAIECVLVIGNESVQVILSKKK